MRFTEFGRTPQALTNTATDGLLTATPFTIIVKAN